MGAATQGLTRSRETTAARALVERATPSQRNALLDWVREIGAIRESSLSAWAKAQSAIAATARQDVLIPLLKQVPSELKNAGSESKRVLWDERGWGARFAMLGITVATAGFSGQWAGVAALGRAVGVPLWLVFGAGGAFLGALVEELTDRSPSTTYSVIEAHRVPSTIRGESADGPSPVGQSTAVVDPAVRAGPGGVGVRKP